MPPPKLFSATAEQLLADAQALAPVFTPEWTGAADPKDAGHALLVLAVRLMDLLSDRINRVPEKNLLAFLDLVGVEQSPGLPAEAPVTFLLSSRSPEGAQVPAGTQVATTQSETANASVFETRNAFFATPAVLGNVVNLVPGGDLYAVLSQGPLPPTPAQIADTSDAIEVLTSTSASLQPVPHELYVASAVLFGRKDPVDVQLAFTIASGGSSVFQAAVLQWQRFDAQADQWVDIANVTYVGVTNTSATVRFNGFPGSGPSTVDGIKDVWIRGRLIPPPATLAGLPVVSQITGSVATAAAPPAAPDAALFNDTPLDLSRPARPFGERPRYGDAFHVGSAKAFGPDVASATLRITLRIYTVAEVQAIFASIPNATTVTVTTTVEWQYLATGGLWKPLPSATFTHALSVTGGSSPTVVQTGSANQKSFTLFGTLGSATPTVEIPFTPPADMATGKVGGVSGRWVRAVLRSTDPYGRDGFVTVSGTTVTAVGPTFVPPIVEKVEIAYQYSTASVALDRIATSNNFEIATRSAPVFNAGPLKPFIPLSAYAPAGAASGPPAFLDSTPGLYFAFDRSLGSAFVSVLLAFVEPHDAAQLMPETGDPRVVWEYVGPGGQWRALDVRDGTATLTSTGVVGFAAPADSTPLTVFSQLTGSQPRYWYRARLASGSFTTAPRLAAVVPNTVMTDQQQTVRDDFVLASGSGEQHQSATILRRPVLAGEIWVREDEVPSDAEIAQIIEELRARAFDAGESGAVTRADVVDQRPGPGGEPEVWVRWLRVPNFFVSGPRSRHYTLNPVSGVTTFGDGRNGLIAAAAKDNIVVRGLQSGGGEAANSAGVPLAIKELKTSLPFIDKVFNLSPAVGGTDPWGLDQIVDLGPQTIKNRGRAVSVEDYEWVTMAAFGQVARTRALATKKPAPGGVLTFKPGAVSIIIVPKGTERRPQPSRGLLRRIEAYLRQRAFGAILSEIYALPPLYTEVSIAATVKPVLPEERTVVERRIVQALEAFFHPLTGGERREGWPFGRSVHLSEVFAVIERVGGVDHVVTASFIDLPGAVRFDVNERALVASGAHQIVMV
ncbi:MAG TPA: hypothetical protein VFO21_09420 [Vicinamibacterales bacterium]|nr:hypothetical protein [Vicinamibacterales bacterium]